MLLSLSNSEILRSYFCGRGGTTKSPGNHQSQPQTHQPSLQTSKRSQNKRAFTATPTPSHTHAHTRTVYSLSRYGGPGYRLCSALNDVYESSGFGSQIRSIAAVRWQTGKREHRKSSPRYFVPLLSTAQNYTDALNHIPFRVAVVQTKFPWHWTLGMPKYGAVL